MNNYRHIGVAKRLVLAILLLLTMATGAFYALLASQTEGDGLFQPVWGISATQAHASPVTQAGTTDPQLSLSMGILATDNLSATFDTPLPASLLPSLPGAVPSWTGTLNSSILSTNPIPSTVANINGNDRVTVALLVENLGGSSVKLSNIRLQGTGSPGIAWDASPLEMNIQGQSGAGSALDVELLPGGLFGDGIVLNNPDATMSVLDGYDPASGKNLAVVTLDLSIRGTVTPSTSLPLSVRIVGYTFEVDGSDIVAEFPLENISADADIQVGLPEIGSSIVGVSQLHSASTIPDVVPVTVGDIITYEVTLALPEGRSPEGFFKSELDRGFALVDVISIEASQNVTTNVAGGFEAVRGSVRLIETNNPLPNQGQKFDLYFGEITVANSGNGHIHSASSGAMQPSLSAVLPIVDNRPGIIRMRYRVVALNNDLNDSSKFLDDTNIPQRNHYLQWCWSVEHHIVTGNTPDVAIVEPNLVVTQTISPSAVEAFSENSEVISDSIRAGEVMTISVAMEHSEQSTAAAFEASIAHVLPPELQYMPGTLTWVDQDGQSEPTNMRVMTRTIDGATAANSRSHRAMLATETVEAMLATETVIEASWGELGVHDAGAIQFQVMATDMHLPLSLDDRTLSVESQSVGQWSSVPGVFNQSLSTYHDLAAERTGNRSDIGGVFNDYMSTATQHVALFVPATPPERARVQTELTVTNLTRSRGAARPGDTLRYSLLVQNIGNTPAVNVQLTNRIDANLMLIGNSVTLGAGVLLPVPKDGDPVLTANLQTLLLDDAVEVQYEAVVRDTLRLGTSQIVNQALVHGDNFPLAPSDNPATAEHLDPTVLYTDDAPRLFAYNSVELLEDVDNNQRISKGDKISYEVEVMNRGHSAASKVQLYNRLGDGLQLVLGSVEAVSGTITSGLEPGQTTLQTDLTTLAAGASKQVSFDAQVTSASSNLIRLIGNQGVVVAENHAAVLSDNPETLTANDTTQSGLTDSADVVATKSHYLLADNDENGYPSAGDHIAYRIVLQNYGSASADELLFTDPLDPATSLVADTLQLASGAEPITATVVSGSFTTTVQVEIPTLAAAGSFNADQVILSYVVEIETPTARVNQGAAAGIIRNQGRIAGDSLPAVLTHDPFRSLSGAATETYTNLIPRIEVLKRDVLLLDSDGNHELSPLNGMDKPERLLYQITVANVGNMAAQSVVLEDTLDSYARLIPETVRTSRGDIVVGTSADSKNVIVEFGAMAQQQVTGAPEQATVSFEIELSEISVPRPIENVASVLVDIDNKDTDLLGQYTLVSDDPETILLNDPTITPVTQTPTELDADIEPEVIDNRAPPSIYLPLLR